MPARSAKSEKESEMNGPRKKDNIFLGVTERWVQMSPSVAETGAEAQI